MSIVPAWPGFKYDTQSTRPCENSQVSIVSGEDKISYLEGTYIPYSTHEISPMKTKHWLERLLPAKHGYFSY